MASSVQRMAGITQRQPIHPEVSEFMVRKLDGRILPILNATPESGLRYDSYRGQWMPESENENHIDFEQIYSYCVQAQNSLIETANKLARKRKLPNLQAKSIHSWTEVEESVSAACQVLEGLAEQDDDISAGFTGKLKGAFRKFCQNAGAGTTLINLIPTDNYLSVLCGGLKVIFMALQQTDHFRKDIYSALEDLPFILSDHVAMVELGPADEELHRRAAALYASLFKLMEVIFSWFLKSSLATGAKLFVNPSKFSETLKNKLADVKLSAQRVSTYMNLIATKRQQNLEQQTYSMVYMQGKSMHVQNQNSREIMDGIDELKKSYAMHAMILEQMSSFLETQMDSGEERRRLSAHEVIRPSYIVPSEDIDKILYTYFYDLSLVTTDCEYLLRIVSRQTNRIDHDHIHAIKANPLLKAWLTLNESALLLLNANSDDVSSLDMSFVSAQAFQRALEVSTEQANTETKLLPLAFFCSRHENYQKDPNGPPSELAMSLLLQLVDKYRDFIPEDLAAAFDDFNPVDIGSILGAFGYLISRLPATVIVILIVDGLKYFGYPKERKGDMRAVVAGLVNIHRQKHAAMLKFLFANSKRVDFVEDLFTDDEYLKLPRESFIEQGYNTMSWRRPIKLESPEQNQKSGSSEDEL